MKYEKIIKGKFIERPNRFVAVVNIDGKEEKVHVKNTGRCKELLVLGATVYLEDYEGRMGTRKMRYSLIAVEKKDILINMDSQAPNKVVKEALQDGTILLKGMEELESIKQEKTFGNSRLDFLVTDKKGKKAYIEVKGATLEIDGIAKFPDAPTQRGVKHVEELEKAGKEGFGAYVIFVIQMIGPKLFKPNDVTHKAFGETLRKAKNVEILAYDCLVKKDSLKINKPVPVEL